MSLASVLAWLKRVWTRGMGLLKLDRRITEQAEDISGCLKRLDALAVRVDELQAALVKSGPRLMPEYKGVRWSPREHINRAGDQKNIAYCPWCYTKGYEMPLRVITGYKDGSIGLQCENPEHSKRYFHAMDPHDYAWAANELDTSRLGGPDPQP